MALYAHKVIQNTNEL